MGRRTLSALVVVATLLVGCGGDGNGGAPDGDTALGREVFVSLAEPSCGSCHALADAGTTGTIGPDLDTLQPSRDQVAQAVRSGPGAMPSFADQLSDEQVDAVAAYVSEAAG